MRCLQLVDAGDWKGLRDWVGPAAHPGRAPARRAGPVRDHDLADTNPMDLLARTKVPKAAARGVDPARVEKILVARTGLRASEALGVDVDGLTLTADDEHVTVHGKVGGPLRYASAQELRAKYNAAASENIGHGPRFRPRKLYRLSTRPP